MADRTTIAGEPLHEFFGRCPESYNIHLEADGYADEDGSGRPGIGVAGSAIQFYVGQQKEAPTVGDVARVFRMPPEAVAQAVTEHPWMLLGAPYSGPVESRVIDMDGE